MSRSRYILTSKPEREVSLMTVLGKIRSSKRAAKIAFIILTVVLGAGLVGSFAIWSSPQIPTSPADYQEESQPGLELAARQYEARLKDNPEDIQSLSSLAGIYLELGKMARRQQNFGEAGNYFTLAAEKYKLLVAKEPENTSFRLALAEASAEVGDYNLAEENYRELLKLDPQNPQVRLNYGLFLYQYRNDEAGAVEQWEAGLKLQPGGDVENQLKGLIDMVRGS